MGYLFLGDIIGIVEPSVRMKLIRAEPDCKKSHDIKKMPRSVLDEHPTFADAWAEPFARPDVRLIPLTTDATLYKRTLALFERTGSALSDADRAKFLDLKAKISALELEFQTNIKRRLHGTMFANSPSTRGVVSAAYNSRCVSSSLPVLVRLLGARHDAARILGYCWADYRLSACMARTSPAVIFFLMRVLDGVKKRLESDMEGVMELKAKTEGTALRRRSYEDVFRLKFTPVNDRSLVWNDEVQYYRVNERSESDVEGELVGYFALDMHPRPGKYPHRCVVPLLPVACNVENLARLGKDGQEGSALTKHYNRFGHILHHMCTRSEHYLGSWTWSVNPYPGGVELDYLEIPSQTLKNFLWQPSILRLLSSHHTTSAPLPESLITGLSRSRNIMSGYHYSRQIFLSLWDMETEEDVKSDVDELKESFENGWRESTGLDVVEGTMMAASWYLPAMGYDPGYYSYLWAEVVADTGARYRTALLQPGVTRDAEDMSREFLGREPNEEAFLREIMAE
ncbi:zincin [Gonapodya prolifera JEL478]|uniref:Zincin n=1 Tax=Gonapodya prolifera (strain JEL478) TaxID=1344416 RepID=A0A139A2X9_GONPJ|nr:zincin [Gonapodya prolifera JEL478]|eukprot:KXS10723.1 zincin [Gonapodya prolifera JEL478]